MPKVLSRKTVREVQRRALARGGTVRTFHDAAPGKHHSQTVVWDVARDCTKPVLVELHGRPSAKPGGKYVTSTEDGHSNFVEMTVQCRRCENCLRRRARMWEMRAKAEYASSSRTWLATLTLNPSAVIIMLSRARHRLHKSGVKYEDLAGPERFLELEAECWKEVQKWLKTIVKGKSIRRLTVTEAHVSGLPHWHVLLHESGAPLRYDNIKGSWKWGFDSYKLIRTNRGAGYVCKYLTKAHEARVRASLGYGGTLVPDLPPIAEVNRRKEGERETTPPIKHERK